MSTDQRTEYEKWVASLAEQEREPTRAEMWEEMERLDAQADRIRRHELPSADLMGRRHGQRLRTKVEYIEALSLQLFGKLHSAVTWDEADEQRSRRLLCDYCGAYQFRDKHDRFTRGGICPRCDPAEPGVSRDDPNWNPTLDRR